MNGGNTMSTRSLVGVWTDPGGRPARGTIRFVPSTRLVDAAAGTVILPTPVTAALDQDGAIDVQLLCTDTLEPAGWVWEAHESLVGIAPADNRVWHFLNPSGPEPLRVVDVMSRDRATPGPVTPGPVGPTGPTGPQGIQGIQGPQGPQGIQGPQGETGDRGPQGIQGPVGIQGPQGDIGPIGPIGPAGPSQPTGTGSPEGKRPGSRGDLWVQTDHPVAGGGVLVWRKAAVGKAVGQAVTEAREALPSLYEDSP